MIRARTDGPERTALERTAFSVLGATTRDNRRRLIELAEEKSLASDGDVYSRARADLMNPRNRITAELAWLPGLSPSRANNYCDLLKHDLDGFLASATNESPLVKANLVAAAIEQFDPATDETSWVQWIMELADATDRVDPETVRRVLNEDRAVAGFPEIPTTDAVDAEWVERRRAYRNTIKDALDRIPTAAMIQVVADVVDVATAGGTRPGPILIDDLIDAFEVEARPFLDREAENVRRLIQAVNDSGPGNEPVVARLFDGLERVLRNWNRIAGPLQKSMHARGIEHPASRALAHEIREFGVDLYNTRGELGPAQRLTRLSQEVFADLFDVAHQLKEDAGALDNIAQQQRALQEQSEEWAREITYEAEIGFGFKNALRLSTAGVEWKNTRYPLEAVTRIGWGGTRHSVNFIPTGTTYKILFGDDKRLSTVELNNSKVYSDFVDRLWRAVGVRLLLEMVRGLGEGTRYHLGTALLDDRGVELPKQRLFKADERVYATWDRVQVWTADGSFYIGVKDDKAACVALPYQQANNAHVIEAAIRAAFKQGADRLSDILRT